MRYRVLIATASVVAFAALVSVAATHLHIGADADEACAVCAAVIGKLEGPPAPPVVIPPATLAQFWQRFVAAAQVARGVVVVLPPSCGPPDVVWPVTRPVLGRCVHLLGIAVASGTVSCCYALKG